MEISVPAKCLAFVNVECYFKDPILKRRLVSNEVNYLSFCSTMRDSRPFFNAEKNIVFAL